MLDSLRRGAQGVVAKILFGVLILSFVVWGVADVFRGYGEGAIARVGKTEISVAEFQQSYQAQLDNLRRRFGGRITPEQARAFGFDTQVLQQLIGAAAIDNHTRALQLGLSEDAVAEKIKKDQRFTGIDSKFSKPAFDGFLRQNGLSERKYIALHRRDEVRDQLTVAMMEAVHVPNAALDLLHKHREETRIVQHFAIDPAKLAKLDAPDDVKLTATYEQNKRQFVTPEQRRLSMLLLTVAELKKDVVVADSEIKAAFEQSPERFSVPEKRKIQQLAFADKAAAESALKAITGGKSFVEVAKAAGAKDADIELGLVTKRSLIDPKIADAAFALAKDKVSGVVEGRFAIVLLRVTEIEPGKQKALSEVAAEIRDGLAGERAAADIQKLHDTVDDNRSSGKSLQQTAEALKLKYLEIAATDAKGQTPEGKPALEGPDAERIITAAFAGKVGVEAEAVEISDGGYAWIDVAAITPEQQKPFDEVKPAVSALWTEVETKKALATAAQAFAGRLANGEAIAKVAAEAGGTVVVTEPFLRGAKPTGLSEQAVAQSFALANGAAATAETVDGKSRVVFKVAGVIAAPASTAEQRDRLKAEVQRQMQSDVMAGYLAQLQELQGVTVNNAAYLRAIGADRQQQ